MAPCVDLGTEAGLLVGCLSPGSEIAALGTGKTTNGRSEARLVDIASDVECFLCTSQGNSIGILIQCIIGLPGSFTASLAIGTGSDIVGSRTQLNVTGRTLPVTLLSSSEDISSLDCSSAGGET